MIDRTVGHYRILERLGGGGMGVVYKAEDTKLGRIVALKFLPPELTRDDGAKQRFLLEARAAAQLDHPNVCPVFEVTESDDGQAFIAMAYYEGKSLAKRIERGPIPVDEAARIAIEVARGLGTAHQAGIIHRDIKPANVMLTANGGVKIVDFGVAKLAGVTTTRGGASPGTLAYMAPEQIRGEPVTPATDLWALGTIFYEMLTGTRPFRGEYEEAIAYTILNESPQPLDRTLPERPAVLDSVIARALTKDAKQRYQTAEEVIEGLETVTGVRSAPSHADRVNVTWLALLIVLLAVVAVGVAAWLWKSKPVKVANLAGAPAIEEAPRLDPHQVVIAPFENRTGDPSLDAMGRFIADWTSDRLARISIDVVPPALAETALSSASPDKSSVVDRGYLLAETTQSGLLVTGEVYSRDSMLVVHSRVVESITRKVVTVLEAVEGPRDNPNVVVQAVADRLRDTLALQLIGLDYLPGVAQLGGVPPRFEAYREYLAAMRAAHQLEYEKGKVHLLKAIEYEPDFAGAWFLLGAFEDESEQGSRVRAKEAFARAEALRDRLSPADALYLDMMSATYNGLHEKALLLTREIDRLSPKDLGVFILLSGLVCANHPREALQVLEDSSRWTLAFKPEIPNAGMTYFRYLTQVRSMLGDHERELADARRCSGVHPSVAACRVAEARALAALGRIGELETVVDRAVSEPLLHGDGGDVMFAAATVLRAQGHTDAARAMARKAIAWYRSRSEDIQLQGRENLARLLFDTGQYDEAATLMIEVASESRNTAAEARTCARLGVILAAKGDRKGALENSEKLKRPGPEVPPGEAAYGRALIAAQLGDKTAAVALLRDAFAEGLTFWPSFFQVVFADEPALDSLRGDPAFEELLKPKD